jgi:hypothetical protein
LYRLGARQVLVINRLGEYPSFGLQFRNAGCFVALELGGQPRDPSEELKRAIDLALALALFLLAAPIIGLLALTIKLADPGPAFYSQWRIGRYGTPIESRRRTMYRDAEQRLERAVAERSRFAQAPAAPFRCRGSAHPVASATCCAVLA